MKQYEGIIIKQYAILIGPILLSILAAVNRFKSGSKWILLHAVAGTISRKNFRYRARAEIYNARNTVEESRQKFLLNTLWHGSKLFPWRKLRVF